MRILHDINVDFMKLRRIFFFASLSMSVAGLIFFIFEGVNLGIDFVGGTEVQLKFAQAPSVGDVRTQLENAGLKNPTVTTIGGPQANELYIRVASEGETAGQDLTDRVVGAIRGGNAGDQLDLNLADERTLRNALAAAPGVGDDAGTIAAAITKARRERGGLLDSMDSLQSIPGVTPQAVEYLRSRATLGPLSIRAQNYVGPSVAPELRNKAYAAVIASMIAMLVYIGFRFRFQWGLGAILAIVHDVLITLGVFAISRYEFSLPVVASFLTLVGYSVNDTIVVFDRIRENLRLKGAGDLPTTINLSINQTLSRTVITSFLTWLVVVCLWLFGGEALEGFAFVLVVGIIVGTYSSIYIASPVIVFWEELFGARRKAGRKSAATVAKEDKPRQTARARKAARR